MTMKTIQLESSLKEGFVIEGNIRNHQVFVDQPENGGGKDKGPTPIEYFLLGLSSCILTIAKIVARQKRIDLRGMSIHMEGDLDSDFLMGKTASGRAGLQEIRITARIDADLTPEKKEEFLREVDRRCPVSENIRNTTPVRLIV